MDDLVIFIGLGMGLWMWGGTWWWGRGLGDWDGSAAWGRALIEVTQAHWDQRLPGREEGAQQGRCLLQMFVDCLPYTQGQKRKTAPSRASSSHSQLPLCGKPEFQVGAFCPVHLLYATYQLSLTLSCPTSLSLCLSSVKWGWYND